jgi:hypothetical protein
MQICILAVWYFGMFLPMEAEMPDMQACETAMEELIGPEIELMECRLSFKPSSA